VGHEKLYVTRNSWKTEKIEAFWIGTIFKIFSKDTMELCNMFQFGKANPRFDRGEFSEKTKKKEEERKESK
jgi:hypothetical protein